MKKRRGRNQRLEEKSTKEEDTVAVAATGR